MERHGELVELAETRDRLRWKARWLSYPAAALFILGLLAASLAMVSSVEIHGTLGELLQPVWELSPLYPWAAVLLLAGGAVCELSVFRRKPPSALRVRNELERALIDLGLLDGMDTRTWKGVFHCAPYGRYSKEQSLYRIDFKLETVMATKKELAKVGYALGGFRGVQSIEICERVNRKGYRKGFSLLLWYGDPFERIESRRW